MLKKEIIRHVKLEGERDTETTGGGVTNSSFVISVNAEANLQNDLQQETFPSLDFSLWSISRLLESNRRCHFERTNLSFQNLVRDLRQGLCLREGNDGANEGLG